MGIGVCEHQYILDADNAAYDKRYDFFVYLIQQYDPELLKHSINTAEIAYTLALLNNVDIDSIHSLYWGATLHDIGKICLPKRIIEKPGALTDEEKNIIRGHPRRGLQLVNYYGVEDTIIKSIIIGHHEYKPYSYPRTGADRRIEDTREQSPGRYSIADEKHSELVKIVAIADAYEALQSETRPYKSKLAKIDIERILYEDFEARGMRKYRDQLLRLV
jgi:putative nucleotidyltransferase with HDIG domain